MAIAAGIRLVDDFAHGVISGVSGLRGLGATLEEALEPPPDRPVAVAPVVVDVDEERSHESGPAVEAEAANGIEEQTGLVVVGEEIELLRQRRLVLQAVPPGGRDQGPLVAGLPPRQVEAPQCELVPAVEERGRRGSGPASKRKTPPFQCCQSGSATAIAKSSAIAVRRWSHGP